MSNGEDGSIISKYYACLLKSVQQLFHFSKKEKQQKWVQLFIAEQHEWASIYFFKYPSLSVYYFKFHDFLILLKHILNTFF